MASDTNSLRKIPVRNHKEITMKLAHYTSTRLSVLLFFIIGIWGTLFYFAIVHEIKDETNDELESHRKVFVSHALVNPDILTSKENIFYRYSVTPISEEEALNYKEQWEDMVEYWPLEDEHIPMRVFKSAFRAADHQHYELELRISTLERDDLIQTLLIYLIALYVVLLVCIFFGIRYILNKSFSPLTNLLSWLKRVTTGKPIPPLNTDTNIEEFEELNEAALAMSRRNAEVYEEQKQFIENASHELQTPLAVALGRLELLAESGDNTEKQLSELDEIYQTLKRAVRLNKSLLLLTRIRNRQYIDTESIDINNVVKETLADLQEIVDYKEIEVCLTEHGSCCAEMNDSLARILISNLIKNAVVHNKEHGRVAITIDTDTVRIANSGTEPLDSEKIFKRFYHADDCSKESTGLGLSIVESVSDIYNIKVQYAFEKEHLFSLTFEG